MALFGIGGKKEEKRQSVCSCGGESVSGEMAVPVNVTGNRQSGKPNIKVLGSGCKNCHALLENTRAAVKNLALDADVEYVTDMEKVMGYGVMSMPALVVNETVVSAGRVLKAGDVERALHQAGF